MTNTHIARLFCMDSLLQAGMWTTTVLYSVIAKYTCDFNLQVINFTGNLPIFTMRHSRMVGLPSQILKEKDLCLKGSWAISSAVSHFDPYTSQQALVRFKLCRCLTCVWLTIVLCCNTTLFHSGPFPNKVYTEATNLCSSSGIAPQRVLRLINNW